MNKKVLTYMQCFIMLAVSAAPLQARETGAPLTTVTVHKPGRVKKSRPSGAAPIKMDFNNVDIKDFIKVISKITGKDFILGSDVNGKVTIVSPTAVTLDEAWKIFESVLQVNQLTTVGTGNVIKIVSLREAKGTNISTYIGTSVGQTSDVYVTQVIPLHYITANDMANVLRPFLSSFGNIQPYEPANTLIMTESASNIERLLTIIKDLDTNTNMQTIKVIKLEYATAQSIASIINSLYAGQSRPTFGFMRPGQGVQSQQAPKVLSDDRTNSIILVASAEELASIESLVYKLDVPVTGEGKIHVYYLKNANAEKLASTLATLAGSGGAPARPGMPQASAVAQLAGGVKISADKPTNSLIIIATPQQYELIKGVIEKLDIQQRQVYVQAVIAELSMSATRQLGVDLNALAGYNAGGNYAVATSNMGAGSQVIPSTTAPLGPFSQSGITFGVISGTIPINGVNYPNIVSLLNALETNSQANVLSTPDILATDNEPAQIIVGENVPVPTGQAIGQVSGYTQTYVQRQDVGLKLKLTPQINAGDYVRLKLNFEVTQIIPSPQGLDVNNLGITTSKRSAETTVTVKDRSTIVIGGLIQNNSSTTESKIPFLGDIPLIGWLFRFQNKTRDKTNLVIFLTPYIMKSQADVAAIGMLKEKQTLRFEKETFGYKLKTSPFSDTFRAIEQQERGTVNQPRPLLFTGETYITPQGEFNVGPSPRVTGTTVTQGASSPVTATTGAPSGETMTPVIIGTPGVTPGNTPGQGGTAGTIGQPGSAMGLTASTPAAGRTGPSRGSPLTATTFTGEAGRPTETTTKP